MMEKKKKAEYLLNAKKSGLPIVTEGMDVSKISGS